MAVSLAKHLLYEPVDDELLPISSDQARRTHEYIKKTSPHLNLSKRGIRRVERDWLSDMLSVESLNLSFNAIQSLPEEFEVLTGLVSLDLSSNALEGHAPSSLAKLSELTQLKLNMNPLYDVSHLTSLRQLRTLQLGGCEIQCFPDGFGTNFPCLEEFVASQNGLTDIEPLAGLSNMRSFRAFMNTISELPEKCLQSWSALTFLQLTTNSLEVIPDDIGGLIDLEILDLSRNKISQIPLSLMKCSKLRVLLLNRNRLRRVPVLTFPLLEELDVGGNKIESISHLALPKLRELNLSKNRLRDLSADILEMTSNDLRGLLINHNKLTSLPDMDNPAHLERLHTLNFKYNRFIELPNVLRNLDKAFLASFYDTIPDRVEDHLFIGSFAASRNYAALHMLGITHVINAAGMQDSDKKMPLWIAYRALGLEDNYSQPILNILDDVNAYIEDARSCGGRVLIHCQAGVSRSAALTCAYLMKFRSCSFSEALALLKLVRPKIEPNRHFCDELLKYEVALAVKTIPLLSVSQDIPPSSAPSTPHRTDSVAPSPRKRSRSAPSEPDWDPPIVPIAPELDEYEADLHIAQPANSPSILVTSE